MCFPFSQAQVPDKPLERADNSWLILDHQKNIQAIIIPHFIVQQSFRCFISHYYVFAGKQTSEGPEVFPKDEWFKVGSTVTFCCILPSREAFSTMYLTGYDGAPVNTTSYQTYALTVYLNQVSENSCTNVICKTKTNKENGACVYIGCKYDLVLKCSVISV